MNTPNSISFTLDLCALVPSELKQMPHWVVWKYVPKSESVKPSKVPVDPKTGRAVSAADPANRLAYSDALAAMGTRSDIEGLGIVLTGEPCYDGRYLVALDLDNVPENMGQEAARELWFKLGQPYVERSPSGIGLRMFALSKEPLARQGNAGHGREIYFRNRYVTITGRKHSGKQDVPGKLKDCTEGLRALVAEWWPSPSQEMPVSLMTMPATGIDETTRVLLAEPETHEGVARVKAMLSVVSADCMYERWRDIVWSVLSTGWDCAEELAREWSQSAPERWDEPAFSLLVRSFRPGQITLGTLAHHAQLAGWTGTSLMPASLLITQHHKSGNRLLTLDQLLTIKPEPYRVRGVLPARGVAAIYGASGSGKSFLALDLALAISTGASPWFGRRVKGASTVYVALEGQAGLVGRMKAWQRQNPSADGAAIRFVLGDFQLTKWDSVGRLQHEIHEGVGPGAVVFVDTLNQASPGADENSAAEMGTVIAHANALAQKLDALVVLIHHSGKDAARGMRGHSSLFAAMDAVIEVAQDKDGQRSWRVVKAKDDALSAPHYFDLLPVPLGLDSDGEPVSSCIVQQAHLLPQPVRVKQAPTGKRQAAAWNAIKSDGRQQFSRSEIEGVVRPAMDVEFRRQLTAAREALGKLISGGYLLEVDGVLTLT